MGLPDWSAAKIRLVMLAVTMPVMVTLVVSGCGDERPALTGDCVHVDQALRHWQSVLPDIHRGMAGYAATDDLSRKAAAASTAIRAEAASIQDPALQATVITLAGNVERVSRGNPHSPSTGFPDKNLIGGYQDAIATTGDLVVACPGVGDPVPSG